MQQLDPLVVRVRVSLRAVVAVAAEQLAPLLDLDDSLEAADFAIR